VVNVCIGVLNVINSPPVSCEVFSTTNISIEKSSPTNPPGTCIVPGQTNNVAFELTIENNGTSDANDLVIMDQLPSGFELQSVTPTPECIEETENFINCTFDTLLPNDSIEITINTTVNPDERLDTSAPNQAELEFFDVETGQTINDFSNSVSICIDNACNQSFEGSFSGATLFVRGDAAAFPQVGYLLMQQAQDHYHFLIPLGERLPTLVVNK